MAFGTLSFSGFLKGEKNELSKKTVEKLWANTKCISDGKKKKSSRAND